MIEILTPKEQLSKDKPKLYHELDLYKYGPEGQDLSAQPYGEEKRQAIFNKFKELFTKAIKGNENKAIGLFDTAFDNFTGENIHMHQAFIEAAIENDPNFALEALHNKTDILRNTKTLEFFLDKAKEKNSQFIGEALLEHHKAGLGENNYEWQLDALLDKATESDLQAQDEKGNTFLHHYLEHCSTSTLQASKVEMKHYNKVGDKKIQQIQKLLAKGADIELLNNDKKRPIDLMYSNAKLEEASTTYHKKLIIRIAAEGGIDPNAKDDKGNTLLHYAAKYEMSSTVFNTKEKIDFSVKDKEGKTSIDIEIGNNSFAPQRYAGILIDSINQPDISKRIAKALLYAEAFRNLPKPKKGEETPDPKEYATTFVKKNAEKYAKVIIRAATDSKNLSRKEKVNKVLDAVKSALRIAPKHVREARSVVKKTHVEKLMERRAESNKANVKITKV